MWQPQALPHLVADMDRSGLAGIFLAYLVRMDGHQVLAARGLPDPGRDLGDQRVLRLQASLPRQRRLDLAHQAWPLALEPRREVAQRADRPLPGPLGRGDGLDHQVVGVGLVLVALSRLADEHRASISETLEPLTSSLFPVIGTRLT